MMSRLYLTNIYVDNQAKAEKFYTEFRGFQKVLDITRFLALASPEQPNPTPMRPVTVAALDDTCANLIQLAKG